MQILSIFVFLIKRKRVLHPSVFIVIFNSSFPFLYQKFTNKKIRSANTILSLTGLEPASPSKSGIL